MIAFALAGLMAIAAVAGEAPANTGITGVEMAQLTITQSIIIRVPGRHSARHRVPDQAPAPLAYKEHRGPKCVDASAIGGAAVTAPDTVDLILRGGQRVRAVLEDECPALDYYSGFYFEAPADGMLCADRDSIHTRSGGDCQIDKFRALTPIPPAK